MSTCRAIQNSFKVNLVWCSMREKVAFKLNEIKWVFYQKREKYIFDITKWLKIMPNYKKGGNINNLKYPHRFTWTLGRPY